MKPRRCVGRQIPAGSSRLPNRTRSQVGQSAVRLVDVNTSIRGSIREREKVKTLKSVGHCAGARGSCQKGQDVQCLHKAGLRCLHKAGGRGRVGAGMSELNAIPWRGLPSSQTKVRLTMDGPDGGEGKSGRNPFPFASLKTVSRGRGG